MRVLYKSGSLEEPGKATRWCYSGDGFMYWGVDYRVCAVIGLQNFLGVGWGVACGISAIGDFWGFVLGGRVLGGVALCLWGILIAR